MPEILGDDEGDAFDLEPLFQRLTRAAEGVPGFGISPRYVVSNFHFQKPAHDVIAGIADDGEARARARGDRSLGEPGRSKATGVELLRAHLEYAASGGRRLDASLVTAVPLNDFERSVHEGLAKHGLPMVPHVGTSRYRIDLVAMHPTQPGSSVLAIECDGASYHASPTARDRDRLRQQHLEALGWLFHRIWLTDWFLRRDEEIARTLKKYEEAVARAERLPDSVSSRPSEPDAEPVRGTPPSASRPVPPVSAGRGQIAAYSDRELDQMVDWVRSGGLLTDDQIVRDVADALGVERIGNRIDETIRRAIRRTALEKPNPPRV